MKPVYILLCLSIAACRGRGGENVDGGGCSFRYDSSAIRVVSVEPRGTDTTYDVVFRYVRPDDSLDTSTEPLRYSSTSHNHYLTLSEVRQYDLKPGYTCARVDWQTTHGGCGGGHEVSLAAWKK